MMPSHGRQPPFTTSPPQPPTSCSLPYCPSAHAHPTHQLPHALHGRALPPRRGLVQQLHLQVRHQLLKPHVLGGEQPDSRRGGEEGVGSVRAKGWRGGGGGAVLRGGKLVGKGRARANVVRIAYLLAFFRSSSMSVSSRILSFRDFISPAQVSAAPRVSLRQHTHVRAWLRLLANEREAHCNPGMGKLAAGGEIRLLYLGAVPRIPVPVPPPGLRLGPRLGPLGTYPGCWTETPAPSPGSQIQIAPCDSELAPLCWPFGLQRQTVELSAACSAVFSARQRLMLTSERRPSTRHP